ncbi:MAG: alkaline phosphatase [Paludibacter sp.]|nr:alkaline phosphatase [Paludibacter sp.]
MNTRSKLIVILYLFLSISTLSLYAKNPRNVIFMIGDGMGISQIYAAMVANGNTLNLERCTFTGLVKTYSFNDFTTDSGAGGTALACGVKTKNSMIGMTPDSIAVESILEVAERNGLSTGMVVACAVTHATPASFIAHQPNRNMNEEIASDFLKTDIDVFIGGGKKYFAERTDNRNLIDELKQKNYTVAYSMNEVMAVKSGKLAGLLYDDQNVAMPERGTMLADATMAAIDILDNNKKGFFLMIEGSQIDWASHDNHAENVVREMLDFDQTIGRVLDYAEKTGNTLVIITSDHETGGMTIPSGNIEKRQFNAQFSTKGHSGVPVPVFTFGPGAQNFTRIIENTSFKSKIEKLLKIK